MDGLYGMYGLSIYDIYIIYYIYVQQTQHAWYFLHAETFGHLLDHWCHSVNVLVISGHALWKELCTRFLDGEFDGVISATANPKSAGSVWFFVTEIARKRKTEDMLAEKMETELEIKAMEEDKDNNLQKALGSMNVHWRCNLKAYWLRHAVWWVLAWSVLLYFVGMQLLILLILLHFVCCRLKLDLEPLSFETQKLCNDREDRRAKELEKSEGSWIIVQKLLPDSNFTFDLPTLVLLDAKDVSSMEPGSLHHAFKNFKRGLLFHGFSSNMSSMSNHLQRQRWSMMGMFGFWTVFTCSQPVFAQHSKNAVNAKIAKETIGRCCSTQRFCGNRGCIQCLQLGSHVRRTRNCTCSYDWCQQIEFPVASWKRCCEWLVDTAGHAQQRGRLQKGRKQWKQRKLICLFVCLGVDGRGEWMYVWYDWYDGWRKYNCLQGSCLPQWENDWGLQVSNHSPIVEDRTPVTGWNGASWWRIGK